VELIVAETSDTRTKIKRKNSEGEGFRVCEEHTEAEGKALEQL
jgi:hypothetical protein